MNALDLKLFLALNAGEGLGGWQLAVVAALATDVVLVLPLGVAAMWARGPIELRPRITQGLLAMALALALCAVASIAWHVPRPFAAGHGYAYLGRASDSAFPDHAAALVAALALALVASPRNGWIGLVTLAVALLVGWARVFLGIEYPFDVLGGLAIALAANLALVPARPAIEARLTPRIERWYRTACRRLIAAGYVKP